MAKGVNFTNFILIFFVCFKIVFVSLKSPSPSSPLKLQLRWKT